MASKRKQGTGGGGGKKAKGTGGGGSATINVDKGFAEVNIKNRPSTGGGVFAVHDTYAWLGNQTDIARNNNKFYRGQVLVQGDSNYFNWTRWGRVGERGQGKLEGPFFHVSSAVAAFMAKFKAKSGYAWSGKDQEYPGGKNKKYTVIHEKHGGVAGEQTARLEKAGLLGESKEDGGGSEGNGGGGTAAKKAAEIKYAKATTTGATAEFVEFITDSDMFAKQLAELGVDTSKMPLGDITEETIDAGFKALLAVEEALKAGRSEDVMRLCSVFYTFIPHAAGRNRLPMLGLGDIQKKKDMLNVLADVGTAVEAAVAATRRSQRLQEKNGGKAGSLTEGGTKGGKKKKKKEEEEEEKKRIPAPIDTKYASLSTELKHLKKSSKEFKMLHKYCANTQGERTCSILEAFAVSRDGEKERFDEHAGLDNRRLLWHGTNTAVVAAIMQNGLRIMPHSGGRVGSGIYLASRNGKSASYVTANGHTGVMFLCEAALGKQRIITQEGEVDWHDRDPISDHGCNSCLAVGATEPDPSKDMLFKYDGVKVTVPQGKLVVNPALQDVEDGGCSSSPKGGRGYDGYGGMTAFADSEYLVYDETQVRIRYVLKMHFDQPGGDWH